jgi:hypothetical protein
MTSSDESVTEKVDKQKNTKINKNFFQVEKKLFQWVGKIGSSKNFQDLTNIETKNV